jgi:protease YdgD
VRLDRRGGSLCRVAAVLGVLFATVAAGLPGLGPHEARVAVDGNAAPWAAVVRVQVPGISRCTGFLIGPQTAVTAAHCLYGRSLGHFVPPSSVHVLLGYANGDYAQHAVASSFQVGGGYAPAAPPGQGTDVVVITLAKAMGGSDDILALADGPAPRGARLMAGGFSQDHAERLQADVSCTALGYRPGPSGPVLVHDCAGTRGTSGGPVLMQAPGKAWRVAGVQVAGNVDDAGGVAVPAAAIRSLLEHP